VLTKAEEAEMTRQFNNSVSSRLRPTIAFGFALLVFASAANAQFKPCDEREVTASLVSSEPVENFKPLKIFAMPTPIFPDEIREKGTFGVVTLKVRFLAGGVIGKVLVIQGLPDGLTEEAVKAAKGIRFLPARLNGRLVNSVETVEFHFPEPGKCANLQQAGLPKT
jgi:hypothetical protein